MAKNVVIVYYDESGEIDFHVFGKSARLFIIDERAPNDRVYEWLPRSSKRLLKRLIPDDCPIGSSADERHEAIAHRVLTRGEGKAHLDLVHGDDDG